MKQAVNPDAREAQQTVVHYDSRPQALPWQRRIQIPLIAGAMLSLVRTVGPTLRFDVKGYEHVEAVYAGGRRCIFAFWHRGMFPTLWYARNRGVVVMASPNFDGQWASRVLRKMGFGAACGSSTRGGLRGLAELAAEIARGHDAGFAIDGPRGPRFVAKAGPIFLARETGCPIICFHAHSEHAHTFEKAWDLFQMPYPFSRVAIHFTPPINVPTDAGRDEMHRKHAEMQSVLDCVRGEVESRFARAAKK